MASKIVGRVKDNIQAKLPTVYREKKNATMGDTCVSSCFMFLKYIVSLPILFYPNHPVSSFSV